MKKTSLPNKSWDHYETQILQLGERKVDGEDMDLSFLSALGLVNKGGLSGLGASYFSAQFIKHDKAAALAALKVSLQSYAPCEAICQELYGVKTANKATAKTVLLSQGYAEGLSDRSLGSLLMLMNKAGLIDYCKRDGGIIILDSPNLDDNAPANVFVSPDKPYSNKARLRQIIGECEGVVYWFDKHFMPIAFDELWSALDGNKVREVRILSLSLEGNSGKKPKKAYNDLKKDFSSRSISLEWRVIDSQEVKDAHDRWILGDNVVWNIPDVNTIYSGKHSEMHRSSNVSEVKSFFEDRWRKASEHFN